MVTPPIIYYLYVMKKTTAPSNTQNTYAIKGGSEWKKMATLEIDVIHAFPKSCILL
jgi:hypothetical protein